MTHRQMTPLDLVTAYSVIPGREDVALFLEEAMRSEGWSSSKLSAQRKSHADRIHFDEKRQAERDAVIDVLGIADGWWRQSNALSEPPDTITSQMLGVEDDDGRITVRDSDHDQVRGA